MATKTGNQKFCFTIFSVKAIPIYIHSPAFFCAKISSTFSEPFEG